MLHRCSKTLPINWVVLGPFIDIYSTDFSNCKVRFMTSISDVKAKCAEIKVQWQHYFIALSIVSALVFTAD